MPTKTIAIEAREHIVVSTGDDGEVCISTHCKGEGSSTVSMKALHWMEVQTAVNSLYSGLPNEEVEHNKVAFVVDSNPDIHYVVFSAAQRGSPEVSWDVGKEEWENLKRIVDKMFDRKTIA